jgi:hypothetical protein
MTGMTAVIAPVSSVTVCKFHSGKGVAVGVIGWGVGESGIEAVAPRVAVGRGRINVEVGAGDAGSRGVGAAMRQEAVNGIRPMIEQRNNLQIVISGPGWRRSAHVRSPGAHARRVLRIGPPGTLRRIGMWLLVSPLT